ncbi:ATP-dependent Clp protease ATP-binding subunit like [Actinidia chinensis var. chinensis]|uniref:ATP-dependent Clp protease ATP-binding subunit like n=1 Tax=Actinidia chinensis var. chinensis TaxID=1590841 RepID=A0A2R6RSY1_ACTCC|nr:ATP-dependent Clp protease ATP-binding subunit like [Actinidia chinensis var. chinensis]
MATNTISVLPIPPCCRKTQNYPLSHPPSLKPGILVTSFIGTKLSIRPTSHRRRSTAASASAALSRLPTPKQGDSSEEPPKWSARAIKALVMGELEAHKLCYRQTGTESLLLGILVEGTSLAAKFLRANGITIFKVQDEIVKLLGKGNLFNRSPSTPPLTKPARRALDWAVDEKLKSGESGEITATYMLLGIWSVKESAGHRIMATLGFDDEKAKELAESKNKDVILSIK